MANNEIDSFQVHIRFATLLAGCVITFGALVVCWKFYAQFDVKTALEVIAGGVGVTALTYSAMSLHQSQSNAQTASAEERARYVETRNREQKQYAAKLIEHWYSREMATLTIVARKIRLASRGKEANEILNIIHSTESGEEAIVIIFNYFETIALSIEFGLADDSLLFEFFGALVRGYYHDLFKFAESKRTEFQSSKIFDRFERLAKTWEDKKPKNPVV